MIKIKKEKDKYSSSPTSSGPSSSSSSSSVVHQRNEGEFRGIKQEPFEVKQEERNIRKTVRSLSFDEAITAADKMNSQQQRKKVKVKSELTGTASTSTASSSSFAHPATSTGVKSEERSRSFSGGAGGSSLRRAQLISPLQKRPSQERPARTPEAIERNRTRRYVHDNTLGYDGPRRHNRHPWQSRRQLGLEAYKMGIPPDELIDDEDNPYHNIV